MSDNPDKLRVAYSEPSSPSSSQSSRSSLEADDAGVSDVVIASNQRLPTVLVGRGQQHEFAEHTANLSPAAVPVRVVDEATERQEEESRLEEDRVAELAENRRLLETRTNTNRGINSVFLHGEQADEGLAMVELQEEQGEQMQVNLAPDEARSLPAPHDNDEDCSFLELFPALRNLLELGISPRYCSVELQQLGVDLRNN